MNAEEPMFSRELEDAYQRYLGVFSSYWDRERREPVSREDFIFFYGFAQSFRETYEQELARGKLSPVDYYMMTQLGQFLGIEVRKEQLAHAFRHGFASKESLNVSPGTPSPHHGTQP